MVGLKHLMRVTQRARVAHTEFFANIAYFKTVFVRLTTTAAYLHICPSLPHDTLEPPPHRPCCPPPARPLLVAAWWSCGNGRGGAMCPNSRRLGLAVRVRASGLS